MKRLSGLEAKLGASRLTKSLIHSDSSPSGIELMPERAQTKEVLTCAESGRTRKTSSDQNR